MRSFLNAKSDAKLGFVCILFGNLLNKSKTKMKKKRWEKQKQKRKMQNKTKRNSEGASAMHTTNKNNKWKCIQSFDSITNIK